METVLGLKLDVEEDKEKGFPGVVCRWWWSLLLLWLRWWWWSWSLTLALLWWRGWCHIIIVYRCEMAEVVQMVMIYHYNDILPICLVFRKCCNLVETFFHFQVIVIVIIEINIIINAISRSPDSISWITLFINIFSELVKNTFSCRNLSPRGRQPWKSRWIFMTWPEFEYQWQFWW